MGEKKKPKTDTVRDKGGLTPELGVKARGLGRCCAHTHATAIYLGSGAERILKAQLELVLARGWERPQIAEWSQESRCWAQ